jgi:hypothetical protein
MGPEAIMHAPQARSLPKINFGAIFLGAGAAPDRQKEGPHGRCRRPKSREETP